MLFSSAPEDYIATSREFFIDFNRRYCLRITLVEDEIYDSVFSRMAFRVVLESNDSLVSFNRGDAVSVNIQENDSKKSIYNMDYPLEDNCYYSSHTYRVGGWIGERKLYSE